MTTITTPDQPAPFTVPHACLITRCSTVVPESGWLCQLHYGRQERYGLTWKELDVHEAEGLCVVCGDEGEHLDHNHGTGEVRGLLCSWCNRALGLAEDSPLRLLALAKYLRERGHTGP